jgi:hypothetical protein
MQQLLEKLPIVQLLKNFPAFYETRRFITVFTRAFHWSLSWARSIQSNHPISLSSILILFTHLRLGLPSGFFPYGFSINILYVFLFSPFVLQYCPSHPRWLDHSNYTWSRVQVMKFLINIVAQGDTVRPGLYFWYPWIFFTRAGNSISATAYRDNSILTALPRKRTWWYLMFPQVCCSKEHNTQTRGREDLLSIDHEDIVDQPQLFVDPKSEVSVLHHAAYSSGVIM